MKCGQTIQMLREFDSSALTLSCSLESAHEDRYHHDGVRFRWIDHGNGTATALEPGETIFF